MRDYTLKPIPEGWQENVIDVQSRGYPTCKHGTHTPVIDIDDQPICIECVREDPRILARFKSMALVSGGLL